MATRCWCRVEQHCTVRHILRSLDCTAPVSSANRSLLLNRGSENGERQVPALKYWLNTIRRNCMSKVCRGSVRQWCHLSAAAEAALVYYERTWHAVKLIYLMVAFSKFRRAVSRECPTHFTERRTDRVFYDRSITQLSNDTTVLGGYGGSIACGPLGGPVGASVTQINCGRALIPQHAWSTGWVRTLKSFVSAARRQASKERHNGSILSESGSAAVNEHLWSWLVSFSKCSAQLTQAALGCAGAVSTWREGWKREKQFNKHCESIRQFCVRVGGVLLYEKRDWAIFGGMKGCALFVVSRTWLLCNLNIAYAFFDWLFVGESATKATLMKTTPQKWLLL